MHILLNLKIRLRATHYTCVWIYPGHRHHFAWSEAELRRLGLSSANGRSMLSIPSSARHLRRRRTR